MMLVGGRRGLRAALCVGRALRGAVRGSPDLCLPCRHAPRPADDRTDPGIEGRGDAPGGGPVAEGQFEELAPRARIAFLSGFGGNTQALGDEPAIELSDSSVGLEIGLSTHSESS